MIAGLLLRGPAGTSSRRERNKRTVVDGHGSWSPTRSGGSCILGASRAASNRPSPRDASKTEVRPGAVVIRDVDSSIGGDAATSRLAFRR